MRHTTWVSYNCRAWKPTISVAYRKDRKVDLPFAMDIPRVSSVTGSCFAYILGSGVTGVFLKTGYFTCGWLYDETNRKPNIFLGGLLETHTKEGVP